MSLRYEIEEGTNAVRVFYPESDTPSLFQPDWPDMTPWANAAEADAWAQLYIASVEDENARFAPNSRGIPGEAKLTAEQKSLLEEARKVVDLATTEEDIQAAQEALTAVRQSIYNIN